MTDFPDLYARHRDDVWRYFRRRTPEAAEDLVTEVFVVAWRRRGDMPAEALPWLYGVARKEVPGRDISDWSLNVESGRRDSAPEPVGPVQQW